ncbi:MAG: hypothetical protein N3F66_02830 [Spirochaetes bacterium]|nr:hypothetical protein [Spirochaetota bacterium]
MVHKEIVKLRQVPLFKHLMDNELSQLLKLAKPISIPKGGIVNSDSHSLYIINKGIFDIQKHDSIYLTTQSFFGELPFCEKGSGIVRSLTDSVVYELKDTDLYQFMGNNFKALRGYLKIADFYRFPLTDAGKNLYKNKSQIITIFSTEKHCGKTTVSVATAAASSFNRKTILLDASYDGISVFDMCGKKLLPPLSQKNPDEVTGQKFIEQRIEKVSETLDILNVAYGSKVRINPEIINPLLFYLSFEYSFIIIDCSNIDIPLRDIILYNSDIVIEIINAKSILKITAINDSLLTQGQQVIYVVNKHFDRTVKINNSIKDFDTISVGSAETMYQAILRSDLQNNTIFREILSDKKAMVLASGMYETLYYAGLFESMRNSSNMPDILYTTGIPYAVLIAYLHTNSLKEYKKLLLHYFSDDKLHSLLDVAFPDKYLFKNDPLRSFSSSVCNTGRLEYYSSVPYTTLISGAGVRMFSTGEVCDIAAASIAFQPMFEGVTIRDEECYSSFPLYPVIPENLLRTHIQHISYIRLDTIVNPISSKSKVLGIFRKFLDFLPHYNLYACDNGSVCHKEFPLQIPEVVSINDLIEKSFNNLKSFDDIIQKVTGG